MYVCFFLLAFSLAIFGRSVLTQSGANLGSIFPDGEGSVVSKVVASITGVKGHLIGHRVVRRINESPLNVLTSKANGDSTSSGCLHKSHDGFHNKIVHHLKIANIIVGFWGFGEIGRAHV